MLLSESGSESEEGEGHQVELSVGSNIRAERKSVDLGPLSSDVNNNTGLISPSGLLRPFDGEYGRCNAKKRKKPPSPEARQAFVISKLKCLVPKERERDRESSRSKGRGREGGSLLEELYQGYKKNKRREPIHT